MKIVLNFGNVVAVCDSRLDVIANLMKLSKCQLTPTELDEMLFDLWTLGGLDIFDRKTTIQIMDDISGRVYSLHAMFIWWMGMLQGEYAVMKHHTKTIAHQTQLTNLAYVISTLTPRIAA